MTTRNCSLRAFLFFFLNKPAPPKISPLPLPAPLPFLPPRPQPVEWLSRPGHNQLRHEPLGVIGIMAPWNYPLLLTLGPLCDALAAGNRALLKPSELTPAFSDLLQRLIAEAFDAAEVAVVTGGGDVGPGFW